MSELEERGFEIIQLSKLDNERVGALVRGMGHVITSYEEKWRDTNPFPDDRLDMSSPVTESDLEEHDKIHDRWQENLRLMRSHSANTLVELVGQTNGDTPGLYSGTFAVFAETEPKLWLHYHGYNDDPNPDWIAVKKLISFDGFALTDEGREVSTLTLDRVMKGNKQTGEPDTLATVPREVFAPYLK